jgi:hypothetical protein
VKADQETLPLHPTYNIICTQLFLNLLLTACSNFAKILVKSASTSIGKQKGLIESKFQMEFCTVAKVGDHIIILYIKTGN